MIETADDPRFMSTIDAVEHDLRHRATVLRYRRTATTGCRASKVASISARCGSFERLCHDGPGLDETDGALGWSVAELAGPTRLLSEQYDPDGQPSTRQLPAGVQPHRAAALRATARRLPAGDVGTVARDSRGAAPRCARAPARCPAPRPPAAPTAAGCAADGPPDGPSRRPAAGRS